ncbi:hypothetical protein [Schaalia suimastitidis]|uniref:hypothetical protein n=1 Tax=Schaalia suimastitidis TaxID=121163 RepID=UPI00041940C9|nr:hypothetical protein [Schaalia suimastitidis]
MNIPDIEEQIRSLQQQLPHLSNMMANLQSSIARIDALSEQIDRETEIDRRKAEEADAARAERARKGELGPEWQKVQRRIDQGHTTLDAVLSGRDDSAEAQHVFGDMKARTAYLRTQWEEGERTGQDTPIGAAQRMMAQQREVTEGALDTIKHQAGGQ